jgi:hypothetical protein
MINKKNSNEDKVVESKTTTTRNKTTASKTKAVAKSRSTITKKTATNKKTIDANSKLSDLIKEIQENKTEGVIKYENGNTYTKVDYRIKKAREVFGFDIRIINSIVHRDDREVIVECNVYLKQEGQWDLVQNGHAHEVRDSSFMNTHNYVEIAETSAMGRALGGLGLFGNEFASHNEMQSSMQHQQQKTPIGKNTTRNEIKKNKKAEKIKVDQVAFIQDYLNNNKGLTEEDILDGKKAKKIEDLTEEEAIIIINYLETNLDSPL